MSRTCRRCGAPVPAAPSFFCNKCGAQLPAEEPDLTVCRRCGKKQADLLSRFCDRCGAPLTSPVKPLPPVTPARQKKACPRCGFENLGTSLFYCKKCGTALEDVKPPGTVQEQKVQERPARAGAGRRGGRQTPVTRSRVAQVAAPEQPQAAPPGRARSNRKVAIGVAAVILILAVIAGAFIFMNPAGAPDGASDNATAPGFIGGLSQILQEKAVAGNKGTAVFSDTPPA